MASNLNSETLRMPSETSPANSMDFETSSANVCQNTPQGDSPTLRHSGGSGNEFHFGFSHRRTGGFVNILRQESNDSLVLNDAALESVLLNPHFADEPVIPIVLNGVNRTDTTFLVHRFLDLLGVRFALPELSEESTSVGLDIWSELIPLPGQLQEKGKVLLLRSTQPVTLNVAAKIFASLNLFSRQQVYCVSSSAEACLPQGEVQNLRILIEYSNAVLGHSNACLPNLVTLFVRNWSGASRFGFDGGKELLDKCSLSGGLAGAEALLKGCFLFPCFSKDHRFQPPDVTVDRLLEQLCLHYVNSAVGMCTSKRLYHQVKSGFQHIGYSDLVLKDPYDANVECTQRSAVDTAVRSYRLSMDKMRRSCSALADLENLHKNVSKEVLLEYDSLPRLGGRMPKYEEELEVQVLREFQLLSYLWTEERRGEGATKILSFDRKERLAGCAQNVFNTQKPRKSNSSSNEYSPNAGDSFNEQFGNSLPVFSHVQQHDQIDLDVKPPIYFHDELNLCAGQMLRRFARKASSQKQDFPGTVYELEKTQHRARNCSHRFNCQCTIFYSVGDSKSSLLPPRYILLVGETGAGKSTLVNGLANAYYQVEYSDPFRFTVTDASCANSQTVSQTQGVIVYTFYPHPGEGMSGSAVPFPISVIDTPGFGDTQGFGRDQEIVKLLRECLRGGPSGVSGVLHGVGFVVKASENRMTGSQKYVFDQILSLFGKDVQRILYPLITFGDTSTPQALQALQEYGVPHQKYFVFNNGILLANNQARLPSSSSMSKQEELKLQLKFEMTQLVWESSFASYNDFFNTVNLFAEGITLLDTKQVLERRQRLEVINVHVQKQIREAFLTLNRLNEERDLMDTLNKTLKDDDLFRVKEIVVPVTEKVKVSNGRFATICTKCNVTCHEPCKISNERYTYDCLAMKDDCCTICRYRCSWKVHTNSKFRFVTREEKKFVTVKDLLERHNLNAKDQQAKSKVIAALTEEYEMAQAMLASNLESAKKCLNDLQECALNQRPLTIHEYVQTYISNEELGKKGGWEWRVRLLRKILDDQFCSTSDGGKHGAAAQLLSSEGFSKIEDHAHDIQGGSSGKVKEGRSHLSSKQEPTEHPQGKGIWGILNPFRQ